MEKTTGIDIVCPYCGHTFDDSFEYQSGEVKCKNCQEDFIVKIETYTEYHSAPVECDYGQTDFIVEIENYTEYHCAPIECQKKNKN